MDCFLMAIGVSVLVDCMSMECLLMATCFLVDCFAGWPPCGLLPLWTASCGLLPRWTASSVDCILVDCFHDVVDGFLGWHPVYCLLMGLPPSGLRPVGLHVGVVL